MPSNMWPWWLGDIFNDTKHRAASMRQLNFFWDMTMRYDYVSDSDLLTGRRQQLTHTSICPLTLYRHIKPQSNGPWLYSNTVTDWQQWTLMGGLLHLVLRAGVWAGCGPAQFPPRCTKCNSPPIDVHCVPTSYHSTWHCNCLCALKG